MPDKKHMEYCIQLGNKYIKEKLEHLNSNTGENQYMNTLGNYMQKTEIENISFREKLRNWKI